MRSKHVHSNGFNAVANFGLDQRVVATRTIFVGERMNGTINVGRGKKVQLLLLLFQQLKRSKQPKWKSTKKHNASKILNNAEENCIKEKRNAAIQNLIVDQPTSGTISVEKNPS